MQAWPDAGKYMTNPPGLSREGAEFLAKGGAITIGADNHCVEQGPSADPENWQVVHTYLAEAGIPMMEIVNLEELAGEKFISTCSSALASNCVERPARPCVRWRCRLRTEMWYLAKVPKNVERPQCAAMISSYDRDK